MLIIPQQCTVAVFVSIIDLFIPLDGLHFIGVVWVATLVLTLVARRQTHTIDIHHVSLSSHKITQPYRFVQLSDVHVGSNSKYDLEIVVDHVLKLDPDFVVITGDLVDEDHVQPEDLLALDEISVPMYFVSGNHEYYIETAEFRKSLAYTSVQDIEDKKVTFEEIDIIGVDETSDVKKIVQEIGVNSDRYTMLLYHEPKTTFARDAAAAGTDLMLSGHTHNGQIWPFTYLVQARFPYIAGLYDVGNMQLFVSQGTQTWGPKMRLGTRNEIILFELQQK